MQKLKRLVFVATLLLALVGGAGQASADPGKGGGATITADPAGVTWESAGVTWESAPIMLSAGITWE